MNTKDFLVQQEFKRRERRARDEVACQGYRLCKSRTRNERSPNFAKYCIVNQDNIVMAGGWYDLDLDDVESWVWVTYSFSNHQSASYLRQLIEIGRNHYRRG